MYEKSFLKSYPLYTLYFSTNTNTLKIRIDLNWNFGTISKQPFAIVYCNGNLLIHFL